MKPEIEVVREALYDAANAALTPAGRIAVQYHRPAGSFVAFAAPGESFAEFARDIRRRWPDTTDVRELPGIAESSGASRGREPAGGVGA